MIFEKINLISSTNLVSKIAAKIGKRKVYASGAFCADVKTFQAGPNLCLSFTPDTFSFANTI